MTRRGKRPLLASQFEIVFHHHGDQFFKFHHRRPSQPGARFRCIAAQIIHLRGTEIARIFFDMPFPRDAAIVRGQFQKFAHRMRLAGGDDEILRAGVLQNPPHRFHIIARIAPIAAGVEIAQVQLLLQPQFDARQRPGDFPGDERFSATRRFVVEQIPFAMNNP